jgi:ribonuclease HII
MAKKTKKPKTASLIHERNYYNMGCKVIFGIDEAGRGPWAGPVSAGAVALPLNRKDLPKALSGVRDSKEMTPLQRASLVDTIKDVALAWGVGHATAKEIDAMGIVPATKTAMQRALSTALDNSNLKPDCLFLDYMLWPERRDIPQVSIVHGDKYSLSIASASVIAKVWRDDFMLELDAEFPQYGFAKHKGYGTKLHREALEKYGPIDFHRQYYKPIQLLLNFDED